MKKTNTLLILFLCWLVFGSCASNHKNQKLSSFDYNVDSIALTPPLGWNSYNCFGGNATEQDIKVNADYMAENLAQYGWKYIVLDFLWYCDDQSTNEKFLNRRPEQHIDKYGRAIPSVLLHPSSAGGKGLKSLGDYIHSKGLKFGLHIMRGMPFQAVKENTPIKGTEYFASDIVNPTDTCKWYGGFVGVNMTHPAAQAYYNSIFEMYADWGVDYIKVDDASFPHHADEIEAVSEAIRNCGREIVFSLSPGPAFIGNIKHLREHANMWRISADFWDSWKQLEEQLHLCRQWAPFVTEAHWPDADMLPLGHLQIRSEVYGSKDHYTYFTKDEQYFMMTLWSIFRSPLMMGGHMPDNDKFTLSLLTNKDILRVNQNSKNNRELSFKDGLSIWTAEDKTEDIKYFAFLNTNDTHYSVKYDLSEFIDSKSFEIKDLWTQEKINHNKGQIELTIPLHGAIIISVK